MIEHHDAVVRTTLTLDDDVAEKLRQLAHRRRRPFKEIVNSVLRRGLAGGARPEPAPPVRLRTFKSRFRPGIDPGRLNRLLDELEVRDLSGRET